MKTIAIVLLSFIIALTSCKQHEQSINSDLDKIVANNNSGYNAYLSLQVVNQIMQKSFSVQLQYLAPQHALSHFAGWLANCRLPWLKNYLIRRFLSNYTVNMTEAIIEDPFAYPSFNAFFTRQLKPDARPIVQKPNEIASPADGFISQFGKIENNKLLQAKGHSFKLVELLGGSETLAKLFEDGSFATVYLAPKDYHRVHMPIDAKLRETIFIPGQLFSVNKETTESVPNLFARNERLVCVFDTKAGPVAVILVGAMLVGSIETVWGAKPAASKITSQTYSGSISLKRGAELGLFKMGSTVIVLFAKNQVSWANEMQPNLSIKMGQLIGTTNEKG